MSKSYWLAKDDSGKRDWIVHFAAELPNHAATVGVAPAEVTSVQKDAAYFAYVMSAQPTFADAAQQWTAFKNKARNGNGASMGPLPVAPILDDPPDAVAPGKIGRAHV